MTIDVYAKAVQLLERIANSVHERETNPDLFCFNASEVQIVEVWILELLEELKSPNVETPAGFFSALT